MRKPGDPWRAIANLDHIHVRLVDGLPPEAGGGCIVRMDYGDVWILLDRAMTRPERTAVLAHELEHVRRGTARWDGAPDTWAAVIAQDEHQIDQAVAELLVPAAELREFVGARSTVEAVEAVDVADHFEVPERIAVIACRRLIDVGAGR